MVALSIHIFSDSEYVFGMIKGNIIRTNVPLATTVKEMVADRRKLAPFSIHWAKGHLGTDGNEQVSRHRTVEVDLDN